MLTVGGRRLRLGRRHSELLVLLLVHPEGRTGDQLGFDLYGDDLNPVTVRAELSRLRRILGPELLDSRPYRLRAELDADFLTVTRLLERGRVAEALDAYAGPLLPSSDAPGVARLRRLIDGRLRAAVLAAGDRAPAARPGCAPPGAPTTWRCGRPTPPRSRPAPRPARWPPTAIAAARRRVRACSAGARSPTAAAADLSIAERLTTDALPAAGGDAAVAAVRRCNVLATSP